MRKLNLEGVRFGAIVVLAEHEKRGNAFYWKVRCDCGRETFAFIGNLRRGATKSCGCLQGVGGKNWTTHGLSNHPLHKIWKGMRQRCRNPNNPAFRHYGGRGINIDPRWDDFVSFYNDMLPTWKPGLSIDRIDVDGNYEPSNCRWETDYEQARNKTTTVRIITPDGEMLLSDASRKYGVKHSTLHKRWKDGLIGSRLVRQTTKPDQAIIKSLTRIATETLVNELTKRGFVFGLRSDQAQTTT